MVTVSNATPRPPHLVDSSLGDGPEEVLHVRVSPEGGPPYISHHRCEGLRDGRAGGADPGEAGQSPSCPVKTLVPTWLSPASQEAHEHPEDALP